MEENAVTSNEDLGFDIFFKSSLEEAGLAMHSAARVVSEHRSVYKVRSINGEGLARMKGKLLFEAKGREDYPAVGDWVVTDESGGGDAVIFQILPRKTVLKRYGNKDGKQIIATNIDTAFIVGSPDRDFNLNRIERYLVMIRDACINPVIIMNKIDLISGKDRDEKTSEIRNRFGDIKLILTSTITESGLDCLKSEITKGKTYCFLGSSGVGKSSLVNKLLGKNQIRTEEVSEYSGRGRHTTSVREMHFLDNGGIVIDNPGIREVGIADSQTGVESVFDEVGNLSKNCRFTDCTHTTEPGCAVLSTVEKGGLNKDKYQNYLKVRKEQEFFEMDMAERRAKDWKFGKFLKKAKDSLKIGVK